MLLLLQKKNISKGLRNMRNDERKEERETVTSEDLAHRSKSAVITDHKLNFTYPTIKKNRYRYRTEPLH